MSDLREDGHADVVVAGLVDESCQLVRRNWSRDGFLSGLRRKTHCQVFLVGQQIRAGLQKDNRHSEKRQGPHVQRRQGIVVLFCLTQEKSNII